MDKERHFSPGKLIKLYFKLFAKNIINNDSSVFAFIQTVTVFPLKKNKKKKQSVTG